MSEMEKRDKLITAHYVAGKKITDIMRLFGFNSESTIRQIARRNGAPPRKNGRPRND